MVNMILIVGELVDLYETNDQYFVKLRVDEETIECKLWEGVYKELQNITDDYVIAIRGSIKNDNGTLIICSDRVGVIKENEYS